MGESNVRSFFGLSVAIATLIVFSTVGVAEAAPAKVRILGAKQSALTGKGVKVAVSGKSGTRIRIEIRSWNFDEGIRNFAKSRSIRLGKSGRRVMTLGSTPAARTAAGMCSARRLTATARFGKVVRRNSHAMVRTSPDCRLTPVDTSNATICDFIAQPDQGLCMLPFPSDFYTRPDRNSPTGKRIAFQPGAMPKNRSGKAISPASWAASDGFSQGQGILLKVPGIDTVEDVAANGFVHISHLSRYSEPDQRAVVIDVQTGKRQPIWVQIDSEASDPTKATLMISPSVNFTPKHRYIVALRNLTDGDDNAIEAPNAFRYYRDRIPSGQGFVNQRRRHFEGIFKTLRKAKVKRSDLYLAWDFTVASDANNYRRALHMRDEAFKTLGDTTMADQIIQGDAPDFTVLDQPTTNLGPQVARRVRGTYTVPCFLTEGCRSGSEFDLNKNGLPKRNGNYEANFQCIIPPVGLQGPNPPTLRPFVYGHGLLGSAIEVAQSFVSKDLAQNHGMIACATDEIGMAFDDRALLVVPVLNDMSGFNKLTDRLQQGLINELFLARLMYHPGGIGSDPAFQTGDGVTPGDSVIDTSHVYYAGASQGGIMGGPLTAISPDFTQSALIVGAMNYSTLLPRSSDWVTFSAFFNSAYTDELSRPLVLGLAQMLWDRGEPNGYAHRMTDNPPPNTPAHRVLLNVALGDHQVSNYASDVEARTAGLKTPAGGIDPRRWPDYEAIWNVPRIGADEYPFRGSAIVYGDTGPYRLNPLNLGQKIGTGTPPYENLAPNSAWEDPHGAPRGAEGPISMMGSFLQPDGYIEDTCAGEPCIGSGWDGDFDSVIPVP